MAIKKNVLREATTASAAASTAVGSTRRSEQDPQEDEEDYSKFSRSSPSWNEWLLHYDLITSLYMLEPWERFVFSECCCLSITL